MSDEKEFKPAWWLTNSHLQTIWPALVRRAPKDLDITRERFELYDGDFVDLDWVGREQEGPIVILLHGFEGSIDSTYIQGMLDTIRQHGWRGVLMHFRGCSGEPNRLPRGYHSGETSDLQNLVDALKKREPNTPLSAIGYSMGGSVLLKWLGETGKQNALTSAIAVSVPYDLHKASAFIQTGFARFYQWYFLRCIRNRLAYKFQIVPSPIDPSQLFQLRSIIDLDNKFTAPLHGFRDAAEYYDVSSAIRYLKHIRVPTLLLHAKDDPFMSTDVIPQDHHLSEYVQLELTDKGGHVGFVAGRYPWEPEYWLEKRAAMYFSEYLE